MGVPTFTLGDNWRNFARVFAIRRPFLQVGKITALSADAINQFSDEWTALNGGNITVGVLSPAIRKSFAGTGNTIEASARTLIVCFCLVKGEGEVRA